MRTWALLLLSACAWGAGPAFDVTSVKLNKLPPRERSVEMDCAPGGRFFAHGEVLVPIIRWAYHVDYFQQAVVPPPVGEAAFDIDARAGGAVTQDECRLMVQSLLADRFKMKLRRVPKETPVYALVVAKDGPKMTKVTEGMKDPGVGININGRLSTYHPPEGWSMGTLAGYLAGPLTAPDRPVVDRTGLRGFYKVSLDITISQEFSTDLATAARRLGLIAEPQREQFDFLVIDHIEMPDEN
jgi:uncharacterized protein (TIGR03435 family)